MPELKLRHATRWRRKSRLYRSEVVRSRKTEVLIKTLESGDNLFTSGSYFNDNRGSVCA
jgi:hypothetical protein